MAGFYAPTIGTRVGEQKETNNKKRKDYGKRKKNISVTSKD